MLDTNRLLAIALEPEKWHSVKLFDGRVVVYQDQPTSSRSRNTGSLDPAVWIEVYDASDFRKITITKQKIESGQTVAMPYADQIRSIANQHEVAKSRAEPWSFSRRLLEWLEQSQPIPDETDKSLATGWAAGEDSANRDFVLDAMVSARLAERIAINLYNLLYSEAIDLSAQQVLDTADNRWILADIESGGRLIDVKNARRSFSSPESYSEHCVPKFKKDRNGKDVVVSAILSPYKLYQEDAVWLGELDLSKYSLMREKLSNVLTCNLPVLDNLPHRIPSWLFEYPDRFYKKRQEAVQRDSDCKGESLTVSLPYLPASESNSSVIRLEIKKLNQTVNAVGYINRPVLFMHIISRFCESAREGVKFPSNELMEILFPGSHFGVEFAVDQTPLALCDPLGIIRTLIVTLERVWEFSSDSLSSFDTFKLTREGVFRGQVDGGDWKTIIAYCGGWGHLENGVQVRCGKDPIFLGEDQSCPVCGYLKCSYCGHCSHRCAANR